MLAGVVPGCTYERTVLTFCGESAAFARLPCANIVHNSLCCSSSPRHSSSFSSLRRTAPYRSPPQESQPAPAPAAPPPAPASAGASGDMRPGQGRRPIQQPRQKHKGWLPATYAHQAEEEPHSLSCRLNQQLGAVAGLGSEDRAPPLPSPGITCTRR